MNQDPIQIVFTFTANNNQSVNLDMEWTPLYVCALHIEI